jgi:hypothetical protein
VRGELDWIVMKALEKTRERRYQTANDFAADIQSYLSDRPILARPVSHLERTARWIRRHPAIVTATSICALVISLAVTIAFLSITASKEEALLLAGRERQANAEARAAWVREVEQRKEAEVARAEQERAADEARAVIDYLVLDMLGAANPARSLGEKLTVRQMLDQAADRVGTAFSGQPKTEAAVRAATGQAYHALGLYDESFVQLDAAYQTRRRLLGGIIWRRWRRLSISAQR